MTSKKATLSLECSSCRRPSSLVYEINGSRDDRYRLQRWRCPTCERDNTLNLAGRIISVRDPKIH